MLLALGALIALAVAAPSGHATSLAEKEARKQTRRAEQQSHAAQRDAERKQRKLAREAERAARRAALHAAREAWRLAHKEKTLPNGNKFVVTIECKQVKVAYSGFPDVPGQPNYVVERILDRRGRGAQKQETPLPPVVFGFEGSSGTSIVRTAFPVGHQQVDIHGKWNTNGVKGDYDIYAPIDCGPEPAFTIEKEQTLAGSGFPYTKAHITAQVGETIDYRLLVTNTGNTPLTFGALSDPQCSSITGGSLLPVEPFGTIEFTCSHTLTAADEGGEYENVATITGTPEPGEGEPKTEESNLVVAGPVTPEGKEAPQQDPPPETPPKKEEKPLAKQEILNTKNAPGSGSGTASKSGVLGFSTAAIPALRGPQGCVRSRFVASVRSAGVASVTFYLDGRPFKHLTSAKARKGLLSVTIDASKLKVGAHRVLAKITMKKTSSTAKAATATRRMTIVRCHSAVVTPRFTG